MQRVKKYFDSYRNHHVRRLLLKKNWFLADADCCRCQLIGERPSPFSPKSKEDDTKRMR